MSRSISLLALYVCSAALLGCAEGPIENETAAEGGQREKGDLELSMQDLSVVDCTQNQLIDVFFTWIDAHDRVGRALWDHAAFPSGPNVINAFGSPNFPYVSEVLANIYNRLDSEDITLVCDVGLDPSCQGGPIARAQGHNVVRLCQSYWGFSANDKVNIFLHEVAHHSGAPADDDSQGVHKNAYRYESYMSNY